MIPSGKWLVRKKASHHFGCNLVRIPLVVLRKQAVDPLDTGQQKLVKTFVLAAVTDTQLTTSLIPVLVPVGNLCKDVCRFTDNLSVPGIFQNDRVSFVRFRIFGDTEPVSAKWI